MLSLNLWIPFLINFQVFFPQYKFGTRDREKEEKDEWVWKSIEKWSVSFWEKWTSKKSRNGWGVQIVGFLWVKQQAFIDYFLRLHIVLKIVSDSN